MGRAAVSTSLIVVSEFAISTVLRSTAKRVAPGISSRTTPSRFAVSSPLKKLTPVRLPPGRARLATRPAATGSIPVMKTTGTGAIASLAASADGVSIAASTATRRLTRSAVKERSRPARFCAQPYSIAKLSPST